MTRKKRKILAGSRAARKALRLKDREVIIYYSTLWGDYSPCRTKECDNFSPSSLLKRRVGKDNTQLKENRDHKKKLSSGSGTSCPAMKAYLREHTKSQLHFIHFLASFRTKTFKLKCHDVNSAGLWVPSQIVCYTFRQVRVIVPGFLTTSSDMCN